MGARGGGGTQTLLLIGLLLHIPDLIIRAQGLEVVVAVDVVDGRDELLGQLVDGVLKLGKSIAHSRLNGAGGAPYLYCTKGKGKGKGGAGGGLDGLR